MRSHFKVTLAAVSLLAFCRMVAAEDKPAQPETPKGPALDVVEMTLYPAVPPRPAMKYRLLPQFLDQTPGNAAPLYIKACLMLTWRGSSRLTPDQNSVETWKQVVAWHDTPLQQLPLEKVRHTIGPFDAALHQVRLASRRTQCDWGLPIREEGEHVFEILLPEVQAMRDLARLLALKARLEMAEGKYAEAFDTLQTGFAMSRHCAEQPFLISGLVSLAITGICDWQLETLIQLPDVPNLYWTITALPRPFVDLDKGLQAEGAAVYLAFPELRQVDRENRTPDQWRLLLERFVSRYRLLCRSLAPISVAVRESDAVKEAENLQSDTLIQDAFPGARQRLIARGRSEKAVDAMAPAQVLLIDIAETYDDLRDDYFKWLYLPAWQARQGLDAEAQVINKDRQREVVPLATALLPDVPRARLSLAMTERRLDALRCIEAIRLYAATHDGKLPEKLSDVTEVPLPTNPVTGKPFGYHLEGDTAILDADGPSGTHQRQYRLKMGASGKKRQEMTD